MRSSIASIVVPAVLALSSWNMTTLVRMDKDITMLEASKADTEIVHEVAKTQAVLAELVKRLEIRNGTKQ